MLGLNLVHYRVLLDSMPAPTASVLGVQSEMLGASAFTNELCSLQGMLACAGVLFGEWLSPAFEPVGLSGESVTAKRCMPVKQRVSFLQFSAMHCCIKLACDACRAGMQPVRLTDLTGCMQHII